MALPKELGMSIDQEELKVLMEALAIKKQERSRQFEAADIPAQINALKKHYKEFTSQEEAGINVGSLVVWKEGLKNRKRPAYGEPAIVISVAENADDALFDPGNDSGSPYFREPLTVQLGIIDSDGEMSMYYFDKRRFRPFGA